MSNVMCREAADELDEIEAEQARDAVLLGVGAAVIFLAIGILYWWLTLDSYR